VTWQSKVLVVANQTSASNELIDALKRRAEAESTVFTLLVPAGAESKKRLDTALARMKKAGLEVTGEVGVDSNPMFALSEVWDPTAFDAIVVSTFPTGVSHWLNADLPQRVARLTDAPVEHVVAAAEHAAAPG
jgi:nucleotide-binding universal stress UspA family protein